jgi:hypothetical protein
MACPLMTQSGHSNRARVCPLLDQQWALIRAGAVISYFEIDGSDFDTKTVRSFSAFNIVFVGGT